MGSLKTLALVGTLAAAATVQAHAADLGGGYPPPVALPPIAGPDFSGGWYLRGDVGISVLDRAKWSQGLSQSEQFSDIDSRGFLRKEIGDSTFVGVGVGYQVNSWLRGDITVDYRTGRSINGILQESTNGGSFVGQNVYGGGRLTSLVALVNGYVDLGTWYGITPYVGAGVGVAHNRVDGLAETGGVAQTPDFGLGPVGASSIGDGSKTSFAWALMGGVAYDVTQNLKLDLGYRYLNFGEAKTGLVNCNPLLCDAGPAPGLQFKDLTSHDFKVGLRWALGGPTYAEAPAQVPLIRKY